MRAISLQQYRSRHPDYEQKVAEYSKQLKLKEIASQSDITHVETSLPVLPLFEKSPERPETARAVHESDNAISHPGWSQFTSQDDPPGLQRPRGKQEKEAKRRQNRLRRKKKQQFKALVKRSTKEGVGIL